MKRAGVHPIQGREMTIISTSSSTSSAGPSSTNIWANWTYIFLPPSALLILVFIVVVYCKCKNSCRKLTYAVEVRPVSPGTTPNQNEVQNSPVYCEGIVFQFPNSEPRSETAATVQAEVGKNTDVESNSEDEYCYPENVDDGYETMSPPQANGGYACAYDHVNINTGYLNTFPRKQPADGVEDDYEYPQTSRSSSDNEYRYAYDWRNPGFREATLSSSEPAQEYTPLDKDEVDDNFYGNYQTLSRESLEKENETIPLEYVDVL